MPSAVNIGVIKKHRVEGEYDREPEKIGFGCSIGLPRYWPRRGRQVMREDVEVSDTVRRPPERTDRSQCGPRQGVMTSIRMICGAASLAK